MQGTDEEIKKELIDFENEIKAIYLDAQVRAPVHLCGGNEDALIKIFKQVNKEDWVFSTHRAHYHALLKGLSREWVKKEIIEKRSMHLNSKEHKFFTSAIVGGALPIALGVALALKRKNQPNKVWVFVGDMAAEMGVFHETVKYAKRNNLPINFVIEDNGLSVESPTQKVWGEENSEAKLFKYKYDRVYPHHGVGQWVTF